MTSATGTHSSARYCGAKPEWSSRHCKRRMKQVAYLWRTCGGVLLAYVLTSSGRTSAVNTLGVDDVLVRRLGSSDSRKKQEIRVSAQCMLFPITLLKYWMCNFNDLELKQFKVIQGQKSWSAQGWFYIRLPLTPSWYLSPFSRYLTLKLFFHRSSGEN